MALHAHPHRGLLLSAIGLFVVVFVRLALNPEVFRYEPRGDMRIVNWYLYTYLIAAATMVVGAWWLSKTDDELAGALPRPRYMLPSGAGVLLFLLLEHRDRRLLLDRTRDPVQFGSSIQQDLTYTIAWLIFGILLLAAGIIAKAKPARVAAVALIAVTTFKCFLYDLRLARRPCIASAAFVGSGDLARARVAGAAEIRARARKGDRSDDADVC